MMYDLSLRQAIRLVLGAAIASASICAVPALAQQQRPAQETTDEVIVTGSRIARGSDFESPSPVITIDTESIQRSGYNNLQQLMEKLPANGAGAFSTRGNNQDSTANGAASISLRGLGPNSTLVLVNGRRVAISAFAESVTTNFVDINSIPVAAIERVEVLKDGSSAVYGSDAIAGVINVILRDDFEGFETSLSYGQTDGGDYEEQNLSAIWGFGGDDSNLTMIFDYWKNTSLFNAELGGRFATPNQSERGGQDFRSSRGYPGAFRRGTAIFPDPSCPADRNTGSVCVFDFGPFNVLIPEAERTGLLLLGKQGLGNGMEVFTEIAVQHNTSIAQGAPTPLDDQAGLTVPATHPNNPFGGTGVIDIYRYRTVDAGPRRWNIETDNLRGVLGIRGELAGWNWEVAGQRARSESEQVGGRSDGWVRTDLLQQEIDAGRYNPFGATQNPDSVLNAISTSLIRRGKSDFTMLDASVTGELFDLGNNTVRMATGVEYREERVSDTPDDQFIRGLIFGTESVSAAASRDSWAAYVEFAVPILDNLELDLAVRYDDYSDFGSTTNPKLAARWEPISGLAVRASWGTGFRAPSLAQIGLGPSQESLFFIDTFGCAINPAYCASTDYTIVFSGNEDLEAEESESFNVGLAWQASDSMEVTLDLWDIVQENKIDQVPFGFLYQQFCNEQTSTVCVRGTPIAGQPLGALQEVNTSFINIGEESVRGIDLGAYYRLSLAGGSMILGANYSYLMDFERVELNQEGTSFVTRALTGEYEYPEHRGLLSADWSTDIWGVYAQLNYVGEFEDTPDIDFDGTLDYDTNRSRTVDAFTTVNLQFRYTGFDNVRLLVGVDNVLDEEPPFAIGDGDGDLYGYVQSQHNPRGRFWSAKAIFNF